ncbi:unnamed protein product, partial [Mesorhabditis spiculigera]
MRALGLLSILIWTIAISNGYPLAGEVAHEDEEIAIPYNEEAPGTVPTFEEELEIVENIIIAIPSKICEPAENYGGTPGTRPVTGEGF